MGEEIVPSSYKCSCGHVFHFSEGTVSEMKRMSFKKEVKLGDAGQPEHFVIFYKGKMQDIACPNNTNK